MERFFSFFYNLPFLVALRRLHTVAFYDRVLVLDQGKVAEYDTPLALLQNPYSQFRAMCEKVRLLYLVSALS